MTWELGETRRCAPSEHIKSGGGVRMRWVRRRLEYVNCRERERWKKGGGKTLHGKG